MCYIAGHSFLKSWLLHIESCLQRGYGKQLHPQTVCLREGREKIELLVPIIEVASLEVLTALYNTCESGIPMCCA